MHVFVTRRVVPEGLQSLDGTATVEVWPGDLPPSPAELRERTANADGLLTMLTDRIDAELLAAAPKLKVVANYAVGFNNFDVPACAARGVRLGNTPGVLTDSTADLAVTLMLAAARRLTECVADAKAGKWQTWEPLGYIGRELSGKTLGIVGMGRIGLAVARRLHFGWGMPVLYTARTPKPDAEELLGARRVEWDELLAASDFVSVHCDLNAETRGLFDAAAFAKMKPGAVFVNTSRGAVVDQGALADALRSGPLFAAGLDVTEPEPLPARHELYTLANCVVAPHVASATGPTRLKMAEMACENLLAGLRGSPLPYPVPGSP